MNRLPFLTSLISLLAEQGTQILEQTCCTIVKWGKYQYHCILSKKFLIDLSLNSRGRTTTGMITACLMAMVMNNSDCMSLDRRGSIVIDSPTETRSVTYSNENEDSMEESYLNGEFKIILQVISVLTYGKLAKRLTDKAINMCDHMQNLRNAIFDYKLRMGAIEDPKSKQYKAIEQVALNYLIRYFYLIVFANYLLEELDLKKQQETERVNPQEEDAICDDGACKAITFKQWLESRREITNILKLQSIEFN